MALLLVPVPRRATPQDTREALRALMAADTSPAGAATLKSEPLGRPRRCRSETSHPRIFRLRHLRRRDRSPPEADAIELGLAAELCTDLARVLDPSDLPELLARTARLLDASGVIVWVADRAGAGAVSGCRARLQSALLARMHADSA